MADRKDISKAHDLCDFKIPLEPGDPRWVDLDAHGMRGEMSCLKALKSEIELKQRNDKNAKLLFTGFPGSGKSTVLKLLKKELEAENFLVIYVNAEEALNLNVPIDTYEILITIASAIDQSLPWASSEIKDFWDRIHSFFTQEVELTEIEVNIPKVGKLKTEIKENFTFRKRIKEVINKRQVYSQAIKQCHDYFRDVTVKLASKKKDIKGIVILFDSLEKLQGREGKEDDAVQSSISKVFYNFADDLKIPFHVVYTIPPWLRFINNWSSIKAKFDNALTLPMCKIADIHDKPFDPGRNTLIELVKKRVPLNEIFGADHPTFIDEIIDLTGGYPRDLLRIMQGVLLRLYSNGIESTPDPQTVKEFVDSEIESLTEDYDTSLFEDDFDKLAQVAETKDIPLKQVPTKRLADWLSHHFILCYANKKTWYDLHPIILKRSDRFKEMMSRLKSQNEGDESC